MSNKIQMEVLNLTYANEIWSYPQKRYLDKSSSSRMIAKANFYSCKMKEGQDLASYVRNWTSISCESVALGDKPIGDEDKPFLMLNSLPSLLDYLTQTMMYGEDTLLLMMSTTLFFWRQIGKKLVQRRILPPMVL